MYRLSEKQIEEILIEDLDLIEPGLRLLRNQYRTHHEGCKFQTNLYGHHTGCRGTIDILCLDQRNNLVVIEIKLNANSNVISQINKYPQFLKHNFPLYQGEFRKILCCINSAKEVEVLCNQNNIRFIQLNSKILKYSKPQTNLCLNELQFIESHTLFKEFLLSYS
ncbi:DUF91 domain-containing protein [Candidatus Woesearchaeota archaeon]|nr:DUF91 domain-containing protein [Candidatus Woesearchaeota archaeon]